MLPPSRVEAAHDQPEESISALELRIRSGAEVARSFMTSEVGNTSPHRQVMSRVDGSVVGRRS